MGCIEAALLLPLSNLIWLLNAQLALHKNAFNRMDFLDKDQVIFFVRERNAMYTVSGGLLISLPTFQIVLYTTNIRVPVSRILQ